MAKKTEVGMMVRNSFSNLRVKSKSPRQPRTAGPNEASLVQPAKLILLGDDGFVFSGGQRLGCDPRSSRCPPTKSPILKSTCSWRWQTMHMSVVVCLLCNSGWEVESRIALTAVTFPVSLGSNYTPCITEKACN